MLPIHALISVADYDNMDGNCGEDFSHNFFVVKLLNPHPLVTGCSLVVGQRHVSDSLSLVY